MADFGQFWRAFARLLSLKHRHTGYHFPSNLPIFPNKKGPHRSEGLSYCPVASKIRGEPLKVMLPDGYYYYNYPCTPPPFFWDSGFRLGLVQI